MEAMAVLTAGWDLFHRHVHHTECPDGVQKSVQIHVPAREIPMKHKFIKREPDSIVDKTAVFPDMAFEQVDHALNMIGGYDRSICPDASKFADGVVHSTTFDEITPLNTL